jgi:hypothetical protein
MQEIPGEAGSAIVPSLEDCAKLCSSMAECNAAQYYVPDSKHASGMNCWLGIAYFAASNLSSCVLPEDAADNEDTVLLFLVDDTCTRSPPPPPFPPTHCSYFLLSCIVRVHARAQISL